MEIKPAEYFEVAAQMREIANTTTDAKLQADALKMADDYDRMGHEKEKSDVPNGARSCAAFRSTC